MGQLTIKLGVISVYDWVVPKTPAEIINLGVKYVAFETLRASGTRLLAPTLPMIQTALDQAQTGHIAAQQQEANRAEAAGDFHRIITQATPLLEEAYTQLLWKHRDNLGALEKWGLPTSTGARGKIKVTRPSREATRATFLQSYVMHETSLPDGDRLTTPALAQLQALAEAARATDEARTGARNARETGVATRLAGAGPLLDLLQLACGMLVVTQFNGAVTPALQDWGYNIIQTPGKAAQPPEPTPPTA